MAKQLGADRDYEIRCDRGLPPILRICGVRKQRYDANGMKKVVGLIWCGVSDELVKKY